MIAKSDIIVGYFSTVLFEALAFPGKMICCFPRPDMLSESAFNIFNDEAELVELVKRGGKRVSSEVAENYWKKNSMQNIHELPFIEDVK